MPTLPLAQAELMKEAVRVKLREGWFPETNYKGTAKRTLTVLVEKGLLECRTVNRRGLDVDPTPTRWYRTPRETGKDVELPRASAA